MSISGCASWHVHPRSRTTTCANSRVWRERLSIGDRALHHGRTAEAEDMLKTAVKEAEAFGASDPCLAEGLNDLGDFYFAQGKYTAAEPLYLRALAITEKDAQAGDLKIAADLVYIADLYAAQGNAASARRLYERAIKITEKTGHMPDLATRLNDLALLYESEGRDEESEQAYRQALALTERALGLEHPLVAVRLSDLALLYQSENRYADAEPLYRRALEIKEKSHSHDLDGALNNLAMFYEAQERYADAEPLYQKALQWTQETFGKSSPRLVPTLQNYASLLRRVNRAAEAGPLDVRAQAILLRRRARAKTP